MKRKTKHCPSFSTGRVVLQYESVQIEQDGRIMTTSVVSVDDPKVRAKKYKAKDFLFENLKAAGALDETFRSYGITSSALDVLGSTAEIFGSRLDAEIEKLRSSSPSDDE